MGSAHPTGCGTPNTLGNSAPLLADTSEGNLFSIETRPWASNPRIEDTISINSIYQTNPKAGASTIFNRETETFTPHSSTQIASYEGEFLKPLANDLAEPQITINKVPSSENAPSHDIRLQIAPNQIWHITELPFRAEKVAIDESTSNYIHYSPSVHETNMDESSFSKINPFNIKVLQGSELNNNSPEVSFPSLVPSQQLFTSNLSHDNTYELNSIYSTARSIWHTNTSINLTFDITNLPTGQLAESTITGYDSNGRPNAGTLTLDSNGNGSGWFIDTTTFNNYSPSADLIAQLT